MSENLVVAEASEPPRKLSTVLRELAEGTSLHGLPKIVTSRQLGVKIIWFLLLLGKYTFVRLKKQILLYFFKTEVDHNQVCLYVQVPWRCSRTTCTAYGRSTTPTPPRPPCPSSLPRCLSRHSRSAT